MKTFNNKSITKNLFATLIGFVGLCLLSTTWMYHIMAQWVMMPKDTWLNPLDQNTWVIDDNYPSGICYYYCNLEATMISHLCIMRVKYDDDYCHPDEDVSVKAEQCTMKEK